ncbi:hypothetical protein BR63_00170 [Thermanaerosceptrum fracticalcis]|uniref:Sodium:glutamate symporter n=1 Tax=Thermanaerosceptrum fracticalcis TaxID=1712410 RepID=A0A7G6DYH8_THEFR|nr:hypothetical protein [Thermanaerosceptrum fracticalcis]QNB44882.1 hypothetical protein BR63_00170 [Thermanaerosceptrum fracticalcis]
MKLSVIAAFSIILIILTVGEVISAKTKAFVPSVFVSAVLFLLGFWTFLPPDIITQGSFAKPVVFLFMYLLITHMGTLMSVSELLRQWRTVLIGLAGNAGICLLALTLGNALFGWEAVVAATPPLTGGVVASILMTGAAKAKGLTTIAVLATSVYIMQGFFGYPITAWLLKKEGKRLVDLVRSGKVVIKPEPRSLGAMAAVKQSRFRIIPPLPEKYQTPYIILAKLGIVAWLASQVAPLIHVNEFVLCLLFGVIGREIGLLEEQALNKANAFGFLMTGLMAFIFANLAEATPAMLAQIALPLFGLIIIGMIGMAIMSILVGKLLGETKEMALSVAMTALYGFPADYILTIEAIKSVSGNEEEYHYTLNQMLPKMLVGGFVTVTITSVIIAGFFVKLL